MRSKVNAQFKLRDAGSRKRDRLIASFCPRPDLFRSTPINRLSQGPSACLKRAIECAVAFES